MWELVSQVGNRGQHQHGEAKLSGCWHSYLAMVNVGASLEKFGYMLTPAELWLFWPMVEE